MTTKLVLDSEGHVVGIEENAVLIPLKTPIPIEQAGELKAILEAAQRLDLRGLGKDREKPTAELDSSSASAEWDDEDLKEFVGDLTDSQRVYLGVLVANGEGWLFMGELLERMNKKTGKEYNSQSIAGVRQGLGRRARNWYKSETVDENVWVPEEWMNRYRIRPAYLSRLRKLLAKS